MRFQFLSSSRAKEFLGLLGAYQSIRCTAGGTMNLILQQDLTVALVWKNACSTFCTQFTEAILELAEATPLLEQVYVIEFLSNVKPLLIERIAYYVDDEDQALVGMALSSDAVTFYVQNKNIKLRAQLYVQQIAALDDAENNVWEDFLKLSSMLEQDDGAEFYTIRFDESEKSQSWARWLDKSFGKMKIFYRAEEKKLIFRVHGAMEFENSYECANAIAEKSCRDVDDDAYFQLKTENAPALGTDPTQRKRQRTGSSQFQRCLASVAPFCPALKRIIFNRLCFVEMSSKFQKTYACHTCSL
jgi:hypothetical protein